MSTEIPGRRIARIDDPFLSYDLEGPLQPDIGWLPISYDKMTGQGCYRLLSHAHAAGSGGIATSASGHGGVLDSGGATSLTATAACSAAAISSATMPARNTIHAPSGAA
jgi:hypothetical protein